MLPRLRSLAAALGLGAVAALALVANAWVTLRNVERLDDSARWVTHTHEVIAGATDVLSSLQDAETGQRGFLLTGEERYLDPYRAGAARAGSALATLGQLVSRNPEQTRRVAALRPLLEAKLAELDRTVTLRRERGFEAARAVVLTDEGKQHMDALRAGVADITAVERRLLTEREEAWRSEARGTSAATLLGLVASLALLVATVVVFRSRARERETAAAELFEGRERLRTTLASIADAVVVTDAGARVRLANRAALELLGRDDVAGERLDDVFRIVNEHTRAPVPSPVGRVLREGAAVGLANHTVLLRPDGSEVPIDDSAAPVRGADGELLGVVLVFRDVSARRATERELQRRAAALEEADRRKDHFLATLSHELRNPLAAVQNAVEVLGRAGATVDHAGRAHAVLERQVRQLGRLVDDLLDVSRIAQGKVQLEPRRLDLAELVRAAVEDHRATFDLRQVALSADLGAAAGTTVEGDPARLAQVLGNLLQNAAKFTPAGGAVTVRLERGEGRARLRVTDTGAGMDAATLARIFEPFVQADETLDRAQGGLGLGLALARGIVELHGGSIRADSPGRGRGAEFVVELPVASAGAVRGEQGGGAPRPRPLLIVVAEDNPDTASTLQDVLELDGHEVRLAHDGEAGLKLALEVRPDVVLCDLGLPGLDGYGVARALRAAGSSALLVALSGYAAPDDIARARTAGFDEHVAKPPDLARLAVILGRAAGARAAGELRAGSAAPRPP